MYAAFAFLFIGAGLLVALVVPTLTSNTMMRRVLFLDESLALGDWLWLVLVLALLVAGGVCAVRGLMLSL